jgi:Novel STAND NTPase 1
VLPKFSDESQPAAFQFETVEVRFGSYVEGNSFAPLETVRRVVAADLTNFQNLSNLNPTLWQLFKQRQTTPTTQFILVFDQFEELFTYPAEQQQAFRRQLAELLFSGIPQSVRDTLDTVDEAERLHLVQPMNVKAVFSIRSDCLSLLDSMKDALPTILHRRYELRPLTREQARDAIVKPALLAATPGGTPFRTPPFEYTPEALGKITGSLSMTLAGAEGTGVRNPGIEAFLLQILCSYLEDLAAKGQVPDLDGNGIPGITPELVPPMANLLDSYLRNKLGDLDPGGRTAAQRTLEDGLLFEDPASGETRRISVDGRSLLDKFRQYGLTQGILDGLERTYLLRREPNTVGGFNYELSHDTLVAPVLESKRARKAEERRLRLLREQEEKERQLAAAQRKVEIERKRRQRATVLTMVAVIGLAVAGWQYFEANAAQKQAEQNAREFNNERIKAEKNRATADSLSAINVQRAKDLAEEKAHSDTLLQKATEALQKFEREKAQREAAEFVKLVADAKTFIASGDCPLAKARLKVAIRLLPGDKEVLELLKKCETK